MEIVIQDHRAVLPARNRQAGHRQVVPIREVQAAQQAVQPEAVHPIPTQHLQEAARPNRTLHQHAAVPAVHQEDLTQAVAAAAAEVVAEAAVADQGAGANNLKAF